MQKVRNHNGASGFDGLPGFPHLIFNHEFSPTIITQDKDYFPRMAKKLTRKEKIALQQQPGSTPTVNKKSSEKSKYSRTKMILGLIIALTAFAFYTNTLGHKYALDDSGLIRENIETKKGVHGLKEIFSTSYRAGMNFSDNQVYRPLSKAMFAIEWEFAPDKPALGHWVNIILYALSCLLLFHILTLFLKGNLLVPFITSLLFAAHPLHSEVVANIKSGDEVLCFLFCLLTVYSCYQYIIYKKPLFLIYSSITFFLAFMAKETTLTWLAVIPLFLYFFTDATTSGYIKVLISLVVPTAIFFIIRHNVLGNEVVLLPEVDNYLVGIKDFVTQKTSAIFLMGIYLKLLFFPHPLSSDGSLSHFPVVGPADWRFLLPFVLYVAVTVYAIMRFRKKDLVSFGIIYFLLTASIISNVLVLIGTNYGERLMYIPSLGFCFCIAVLFDRLFRNSAEEKQELDPKMFFRKAIKPIGLTVVIICIYGARTIARNAAWYDDETLFKTDIETVPNSAHMNFYLANYIGSDDILDKIPDSLERVKRTLLSIDGLSKCINIYPKYADAYQRRAFMNYKLNRYTLAEPDYVKSLEYNNSNAITHNNYANLLFNTQRYADAMEHLQQAVRYNPQYPHALNNLASVYGVYGQNEMMLAINDPANKEKHQEESRRNFETAIGYFKKAVEVDPTYADPYRFLSITYQNLGDQQNADRYGALYTKVKQEEDLRKKAKN